MKNNPRTDNTSIVPRNLVVVVLYKEEEDEEEEEEEEKRTILAPSFTSSITSIIERE